MRLRRLWPSLVPAESSCGRREVTQARPARGPAPAGDCCGGSRHPPEKPPASPPRKGHKPRAGLGAPAPRAGLRSYKSLCVLPECFLSAPVELRPVSLSGCEPPLRCGADKRGKAPRHSGCWGDPAERPSCSRQPLSCTNSRTAPENTGSSGVARNGFIPHQRNAASRHTHTAPMLQKHQARDSKWHKAGTRPSRVFPMR